MAMSQSTLAAELEAAWAVSYDNESDAITALSDAYGVFASKAESNSVPIGPAGVDLGKAAMAAALVGMSSPGAGLVSIPAAVIAFWAAAAIPVSFSGATAVVPPLNVGLAALLTVTFAANAANEVSTEDAVDAIATDMYNEAIIGGTATFPGPTVAPII